MSGPTLTEYDHEPVRGLPGDLPPGEHLLWQGSPNALSLALNAYRVRILSVYFALMVLARGVYLLYTGAGLQAAITGLVGPAIFSLIALGILLGIATLSAHRTVYSITSKRVVIRQGVALESTVNVPFTVIDSASLQQRPDGTGDIALQLRRGDRISYIWLWPHVRPWRITHPEPALRDLNDPQKAGDILARAFTAQEHGAAREMGGFGNARSSTGTANNLLDPSGSAGAAA
jgi:hypothetical protein